MELLILLLLPYLAIAPVTYDKSNDNLNSLPSHSSIPSNVEKILYDRNNFDDIPTDYFQNFPDLYEVNLSENDFTDQGVPDFCFDGIASSLRTLRLGDNPLTVIRRNQFSGLYAIESLTLSSCDIHTIEEGKVLRC